MLRSAKAMVRRALRRAIDAIEPLAASVEPVVPTCALPVIDLHAGYFERPGRIDIEVEPSVLARLFERTREQWSRLGDQDPHWSVLSHDEFRRDRLDEAARDRFYETGRDNAALLEIFEGRTHTKLSRGTCLELGCGVGRVTRFLAQRFDTVIGVDVSAANLEVGRRRLHDEGVANVELIQLCDLAALGELPEVDVFFSVIVLQHNSPPIQTAMLDAILAKIRPGGGCLFQTVTNRTGYSFDADAYIATPAGGMEMHALPQSAVLALLQRHGLQVREVVMDSWTGDYGSYTFFATR